MACLYVRARAIGRDEVGPVRREGGLKDGERADHARPAGVAQGRHEGRRQREEAQSGPPDQVTRGVRAIAPTLRGA